MNSYNFNKFKQSEAIMGKTGCNEINYINKVVEDKLEDKLADKGLPNEPDAYKIESCDEKSLVREAALKIKKDKPDYNIIFVIGNSGRFLDTFVDGTQSASHIIWQRINTSEKGTAFELMKKEAKIFKDTGKSSGTTTVQQILDAEKATAYGFAELVIASNNSASVEYKELDPKDQKIKTVLKINLTLGTETKPSYNKNFGYLKNSKDTPATTKTAKRKLRKLK